MCLSYHSFQVVLQPCSHLNTENAQESEIQKPISYFLWHLQATWEKLKKEIILSSKPI